MINCRANGVIFNINDDEMRASFFIREFAHSCVITTHSRLLEEKNEIRHDTRIFFPSLKNRLCEDWFPVYVVYIFLKNKNYTDAFIFFRAIFEDTQHTLDGKFFGFMSMKFHARIHADERKIFFFIM